MSKNKSDTIIDLVDELNNMLSDNSESHSNNDLNSTISNEKVVHNTEQTLIINQDEDFDEDINVFASDDSQDIPECVFPPEAVTEEERLSFLDIDNTKFPNQDRWKDYVNFSKNLQEEMKKKYDLAIKNFWSDYPLSEKTGISWVDSEALTECEEKVKTDKDRNHTSSFRNLVLHKQTLTIKKLSVFDALYKEFPNFTEVIDMYKGFFVLNSSRTQKDYKVPRPLLLLGNPGIGKTRFVKRLAQVMGTHYQFLDANSITGGFVLTGNSPSWRGADAGFIFKTVGPCPTLSPVILLDEIDKLSEDRTYSPFSTFHQLLDPENASTLYDEFLQLEFNASYIIYVLTANDARKIPPSLLSRMSVVEVHNPSPEHMHVITQKIYTELLSGSKLFKKELSKEILHSLEKNSPREVYQILSKNLFSLSSKQTKKKNNDFYILPETKKEYKFGF